LFPSRGLNKEAKFTAPADMGPGAASMLDNMKQQIEQIGTPFPEESVGAGAKWKVTAKVKSQGIVIDQTATVELLELKDGLAKMNVVIEQAAANQKISSPDLPEGATLEVVSLKSTGGGKLEQTLGAVAPTSSAMKLTTDTTIKVSSAEGAHSMNQHLEIETTMSMVVAAPLGQGRKTAGNSRIVRILAHDPRRP